MILLDGSHVCSSQVRHSEITKEELCTYEDWYEDFINRVTFTKAVRDSGTVVYTCVVHFYDQRIKDIKCSFTGYDSRRDAVGAIADAVKERIETWYNMLTRY